MEKSLYDLGKKLMILKDFFFSMGMSVNKRQNKGYDNKYTFVYENNGSEEVRQVSWNGYPPQPQLEL
jgi:hypothetical protein